MLPFESMTSSEMIGMISCIDKNIINRKKFSSIINIFRSIDLSWSDFLMITILLFNEMNEVKKIAELTASTIKFFIFR